MIISFKWVKQMGATTIHPSNAYRSIKLVEVTSSINTS